ncbi:Ig-like domain-containing protein [Rhodococcus hoagii]|nr:Ig-like domain-containing protein [Prescottella equi]
MTRSITRRLVSTVVAGAMAASVVAAGQILWGVGSATAAPVSQTITTSNIVATKTVSPAVAHPGETVTSTITFKTNGGVDRYLNNLTDHPPAGYQLQSVAGNVWRGAGANLNNPSVFDGAAVQNPTTGAVTVKWTDAFLALGLIPGLGNGDMHPTLTFTYKVPDNAQPGQRSAGMSFDIYSFATYQSFNPMAGLAVSVDPLATTTTVSAPSSAITGAPVTLSANVTPANAPGTVQFQENGTNIGSPVQVSGGVASMQHTFQATGSRSISATFTGSTSTYATSNAPAQTVSVTAPDAQTSTSLTVPTDAKTGTSVLLTANVTPANATGSVQFRDNGADIGTPIQVSGGAANLQHTFTTAGTHNIVAVFTAGNGFVGSTSPVRAVAVTEPAPSDVPTTTTLTVPGTATTGQPVQLSVQVAGAATLPGTVQFYDGNTVVGTPLVLVGGQASVTHTFTTPGAHQIVAVYSGGPGVTGSSSVPQPVQVTNADGTGSAGSLGGGTPMFGS